MISPHDDKRIWIKDNTSMTYQYGSPTLKELLNNKLIKLYSVKIFGGNYYSKNNKCAFKYFY